MKKTLKPILVLVAIAVVCTALLSVGNFFFSVDNTGLNEEAKAMLIQMIGEDANIEELDLSAAGAEPAVLGAYKATVGNEIKYVILKTEANAAAYGTVEILTAIRVADQKIISVKEFANNTDRAKGIQSFDVFKDKTQQDINYSLVDIVSGATITGHAIVDAVKIACTQFAQHSQNILNAPTLKGGMLTVSLQAATDIASAKKGGSLTIEAVAKSANNLKANPKKLEYSFKVTKDGAEYKNISVGQRVSNKNIYFVTISNLTDGEYTVEATLSTKNGKYTATSEVYTFTLSFEDTIAKNAANAIFNVSDEFKASTKITEESVDQTSKVATYKVEYKTDANTTVTGTMYSIRQKSYTYGVIDIFVTFDQDKKIDKISGRITYEQYEGIFDQNNYLQNFIGKTDSDIDGMTGATDSYGNYGTTKKTIVEVVKTITEFYEKEAA